MNQEDAKLFRVRYLLPTVGAPLLEDGALLVAGGRIRAVGRYPSLRHTSAAVIDCGDAVILPPLVNAHCHLELSHFAQWSKACGETAAPADFVGWIRHLVRVRRQTGAEAIPASIAAGIQQLLASGTGAVGDILTSFAALAPLLASPLHGRIYFETLGLEEERFAPALAAAMTAASAVVSPWKSGLSPHSTYTVSDCHMERAVSAGLPLAIHCGESPEETLFLQGGKGAIADELYIAAGWPLPERVSGLSPVSWLAAHGALSPQTLLIHGVQVSAADAGQVAVSGATVVLCPRSNARLGVGIAPVRLYRETGVRLALGTDSLASNDSLSLWDELAFARVVYPEFTPVELLAIATRGGARALGVAMGELIVGAGAHFQLLRPVSLPAPAELAEFLCSPGRSAEVHSLWLNGHDVLAHSAASSL